MKLLWKSTFSTKAAQHNEYSSREKRGEIFVGWAFVWVCRRKVLQLKERIGNEPDKTRWRTEIRAGMRSKFWWAGSYGRFRGFTGCHRRGVHQPQPQRDHGKYTTKNLVTRWKKQSRISSKPKCGDLTLVLCAASVQPVLMLPVL